MVGVNTNPNRPKPRFNGAAEPDKSEQFDQYSLYIRQPK